MIDKQIAKLNHLIGDRLGWIPVGMGPRQGMWQWDWSEDIYWPAFRTGRMVTRRVPATLIGTTSEDIDNPDIMQPASSPGTVFVDMVVPEYARLRMSNKLKDQWVITKWFPPEELPRWQHNFPQAPYPAQGYRIHTNASLLPHVRPTLQDTEFLIECIHEQRSMSLEDRLADMERDRDEQQASVTKRILTEIDDMIPAFGNYAPGKRGHNVSMPSTQKELIIK